MILSRRLPDRATSWVLLAAVLVTVTVTWPLLSQRGYPLARDMVFTPDQPLRPESLGLSTSAPRAVPLDAAVAMLDSIIGGEALARVCVTGGLLAAALAADRAVRGLALPARVFCVVLVVWNPFVVERLALGQWALLLGYAAVWGCVGLALAPRGLRRGFRLGPWLAIGAVTPTGALLSGVAAVMLFRDGKDRWVVRVMVLLAQLPWVIPSLIGGSTSVSDPAGVGAFASRAERAGGVLWTLVGMGGVWDRLSTPISRSGWLGHATSALVILVFVALAVVLLRGRRHLPDGWFGMGLLGAAGLVLAALSSFAWGSQAVEHLVAEVPGAGLLRDAQKWLVWFIVWVVLAATWVVDLVLTWAARRLPWISMTAATVVVVSPMVLMPDATRVVWRTVTPVTYPSDFAVVSELLSDQPGELITVPWRSYRRFSWAGPTSTYDPASRWFDVRVITAGDLAVGETLVQGEDRRSRELGQVVAGPIGTWDANLSAHGVSYVLVYTDDAAAPQRIPGAELAYDGEALDLWRLSPVIQASSPSGAAVWALGLLDLVVLGVLLGMALVPRLRRGEADVRAAGSC